MKRFIITIGFLVFFSSLFAAPIEGKKGKYKGHYMGSQFLQFKCRWDFWNLCWGIDRGMIFVDNWEKVVGTVCVPTTDDNDPLRPATFQEVMNSTTAGTIVGDDGVNETWYQIDLANFVFTPSN